MSVGVFRLEIISPEKKIYSGDATLASFPGAKSPFTVLHGHAPLISALERGNVRWVAENVENSIQVSGGFVEIKDNTVTACVEII